MMIKNIFARLFDRKNIVHTILLLVILVLFLFSMINYLVTNKTHRRMFIFPSADEGKYVVEYRNLSKDAAYGEIDYFIDELLLGSTIERTKNIFTPGTKVLSCFQRGNVLYLNLSSDLLKMGDSVIEIKDGVNLLKDNIKKNFSKVNEIVVFINGKIAFEN